jgi:hypothetical protein
VLAGLRIWSGKDCQFEKQRKLYHRSPKGCEFLYLCLRNREYPITFFLMHLSKKKFNGGLLQAQQHVGRGECGS